MMLWHWLTYGQNAAGLQTITGVLAFIGLIAYTIYTRRMKNLQEQTRRGELFPTLAVSSYREEGARVIVGIRNVGRGAALNVKFWHQPVSNEFELDEFMLVRKEPFLFGTVFLGALMEGESRELEVPVSTYLRSKYLFVVDCHDVLGGRHQFRILRTGEPGRQIHDLQAWMVGDTTFLPWWTRMRKRREEKRRRKEANVPLS